MPWTEPTFVSCMTLTASMMQGLQDNFAAMAAQDSGAPPVTFANSTLVASAGLVTDVGCAGSWQADSGFATTGVASLGALHVGSQHGLLPPWHISGLTLLQHSADTGKGLDMLAGAARDAGDRGDMRLYAPLPNKRLDAAWSFGGSAGAMDSGTAQNDTWYHVHLIKRSDVGSVDALLSTSPESPVLPANFDRFRRLGGVLTDTSTTLIDFTAYALSGGGQRTVWKERALDLDTTVASDGGTLVAMSVPTGPSVLAYGDIFLSNASTHRELITGPDDDDVAADDAHQTVRVQTGETANVVARWSAMVNSAAQIRHRGSGGGAVNGLKITTIGWEDGRRP